MHLHNIIRIVLCIVAIGVTSLATSPQPVLAEPDGMFAEMIMIYLDCNNASVMTLLTVYSDNYTLADFPSSVDLSDPHLENATMVSVMSSVDASMLMYTFEDVSEAEAEMNAGAVAPSISDAFGVSFMHVSTWTNDTIVSVNYTGSGQLDMASFVNSMVSECVYMDVSGFSDAIPSLATRISSAYFGLSATKEIGFNWTIGVMAMCNSTIPMGANSHTIDVLELLGISSLAPSSYSYNATEDYYQSLVWLSFDCDPQVTFISCEPPEKQNITDLSERGWADMWFFYGFFFGNDSSAVETLTFTFGGTIISEFSPSPIMVNIVTITACLVIFKWKMKKRIH